MDKLAQFWRNEEGQDMVEYSLLLAFVTLAAVALLSGMGKNVSKIWSSIGSSIASAAS